MLPSCDLPGDAIESIFLKLPIKSLLRFKAVCKPWYAFITSPYFVQLHLRRPLTTHNLFILSDHFDDDDSEFSLVTTQDSSSIVRNSSSSSSSDDDDISCSQIFPPFPFSPDDEMQVLDCRNGLICLSTKNHKNIILWNPATRKFRFLELPDCGSFGNCFAFGGLGYVEATNDYKIVRIIFDAKARSTSCGLLWIYTLSSDSWKKLDIDARKFAFQPRPPVFINGCLHWLTNRHVSGNLIAAFHVSEEVSNYMDVPDNYGSRSGICRQLVVIRGSLSLVVFPMAQLIFPVIEIWVMAQYGVQDSWSIQFRLDALPTITRPIGAWKDRELILRYDEGASKNLMFYDIFSKRKKYFTKFKAFSFQSFNYIESLESVEGGRISLNTN